MEIQSIFKSKYGKILLLFILVLGIIKVVEAGYHFGQWLFHTIN